jgi:hypothetical protein
MSLKLSVSVDTEFGTCCPVLPQHVIFKLVYARPLRKGSRVSVFLKPCMKTLKEILRIECDLMNTINTYVNEQNSRCVGVMRVTTIIDYKLTVAVSSQLIGINRT